MKNRPYYISFLFLCFSSLAIAIGLFFVKTLGDENKNYTCTIPGTSFQFDMVYIPGGEFDMGSPEDEIGLDEDESPVHRVKVVPFWIGKCEVTWDEFECYAFNYGINPYSNEIVSITRPSPSYEPYDHGWGRGKMPATGISLHAAKKYCEWLSLKTGDYYRLPTGAEWEFACRAGTKTAYSFGDDPKELEKYAWFNKNSGQKTNKVGIKLPNPYGLYDMHGNVWEYCTDYYDANYHKKSENNKINQNGSEEERKPLIRGGSWNDPPSELRSANRKELPPEWWERDPMMPRGIWWLIDGQYVGLRVVRPENH